MNKVAKTVNATKVLKERVQKHSYWKNEDNQRKLLEYLGKEFGVKELDDWCKIKAKDARKRAAFINTYYNGSLRNALRTLYPHHNWKEEDPLQANKLPKFYWKNEDNQRKYLESVGRKFGVKELDDWYKVSVRHVMNSTKSTAICHLYNGSLIKALQVLYPDHNWNVHKFSKVPNAYWKDKNNQRECLQRLGAELGVKNLDDWYHITAKQLLAKKATFIHDYYSNSLIKALQTLYPDHNWEPAKFNAVPRGYWTQPSTQLKYFNLLKYWKQKHNLNLLDDWYNLAPQNRQLVQRVGRGIHGSLIAMLNNWFPETNWIYQLQSSDAELQLLVTSLCHQMNSTDAFNQQMVKLFTKNEVLFHHTIDGYSVDIYVPEWKLALEYQGSQHFQQSWRGDLTKQQQRDRDKRQYFAEHNITLVTIHNKWNGSWPQLRATIRAARPGSF